MQLTSEFLRSRVARRVLWMFVLGTVVPIAVASVLAFKQVENSLKEQAYAELRHASKFYGLSVLERLLSAQTKLRRITDRIAVASDAITEPYDALIPEFNVIAKVGASGTVQTLAGDARGEVGPLPHFAVSSDREKAALFVDPVSAQENAKLFMSVPSRTADVEATRWIAELNNIYLWGKEESRPMAFDFCAVIGEEPIFCTPNLSRGLPADLGAALAGAVSDTFTWSSVDEAYLGVHRELFLPSRFATRPWSIIAAQTEAEAFQPIHAFQQFFPIVVLISILSILLFVIGQIRRRLAPLGQLTEGTRRLAKGEFHTQIAIRSDDEFEELAGSFNHMATSLGKQFRVLTAMSQIDSVILSKPDFERVVETVLRHLPEFVPADIAGVTFLNRDNRMIGRTYIKDLTGDARLLGERTNIGSDDIEFLADLKGGTQLSSTSRVPPFLEPIAKHGASWILVFPLICEGRLLGGLYLAKATQSDLSADNLEQAYNIVDRLTVALSAVERQRQLYRQAHFDELTKLPNRELFRDRLTQEITHASRERQGVGVLFIDLDRFKQVNDSLGHAGGDALLRESAQRLRSCVRESDTVARLSGDEFIIALSPVNSARAAAAVAKQIIQSLSSPFIVKQQEFFLSASIGIALYPNDGKSPADLLKNADIAMYRAKSDGRGRYLFYQEQMNIEAIERTVLETDLRHALERNELELHYQPQVEAQTGHVVAVESLLRWRHPKRGMLEPSKFVALAEEAGLIETIGAWVIESSCVQLREWRLARIPIDRITVNVSGRQFLRAGVVDVVRKALANADIEPESLELEITESVLIEDLCDANQMLAQLKSIGVRVAIDDFGTGYSSLSYLHRFPVDALKIDHSFVQDIDTSKHAKAIINSIIALGRGLGKIVIAEGVEEQDQVRFLTANRCDLLQGYYFSKPLTASDFAEFASGRMQHVGDHRRYS